ncbi:uncharacterized protein LOC120685485 isoform X3 [Panicum virgatum]|uniref:uncharacterized protein LOC120685485 isoform X3 n=1 Tax=Panicum virgatum TaxID=38727 RepID=UPI0019D64468|nr:uncharacterized protein LOC120685485 isoform X3 [Panicum virgatum]
MVPLPVSGPHPRLRSVPARWHSPSLAAVRATAAPSPVGARCSVPGRHAVRAPLRRPWPPRRPQAAGGSDLFSVWLQWKSLCPLSLSTSEMRKVKGESSRPWADWKTAARFGLPWISVLTWKMVRRSHLPTWSAVPPPDCLNQPSTAQYTSLSAATSAYAAAVLLWVLLPPPPPPWSRRMKEEDCHVLHQRGIPDVITVWFSPMSPSWQ